MVKRIGLLLVLALRVFPLAAQDTLTVVADNPPEWGGTPRLVEELRIGVLEGDERYTFVRVVGLVVDPAGVIWVADAGIPAIRRFRPDGLFLDEVGRKGEGPGEYTRLGGIKRLPDGSVAVWDPVRGRITLFGPDGDYLHAVRRPVVIYDGPGEEFQVDVDGCFYLKVIRLRPPSAPGPAAAYWLKLDETGSILDTLAVPAAGVRTLGGRMNPFGWVAPFTPITISALSPFGYQWMGTTHEYALHRPLPDGRIVRIERPWDPIPVRPGEREQHQERAAAFAERWDASYGYGSEVPESKPPYWAIRVDEEGRIWVARHTEGVFFAESEFERAERAVYGNPPLEWWEPLVVDVIEPNGRFLGTLRFPGSKVTPMAAREDRLWTVELGEYDEPYVVRYRIESGGDPSHPHR